MKTNEKQYYTPAIEEFHVGFEYEQDYDHVMHVSERYEEIDGEFIAKSTWSPRVFKAEDYEFIDHLVRTEFVRVKYLNQEDIESLGWEYEGTLHDVLKIFTLYRKAVDAIASHFTLTLNTDKNFIVIEYTEEYLYTPTAGDSLTYRLFQGHLKNKSELKFICKCLGILE